MTSLVSLLVPVLDEAQNVGALLSRFDEIAALHADHRFELVIIDDGSTDGTADLLRPHAQARDDVRLVVLSRNFGSHYAISAGLEICGGDCAIVIGGDMQEPIELVGSFLERWKAGYDVVWGLRERRARDQSLGGRAFSTVFSRLFVRFSEIETYPAEGPSGFLCSRAVIDVVVKLPEQNRNVLGLVAWSGFDQCRVSYRQSGRASGQSKWTFSKLLKLAVDSFVQFSFFPIRFMTYLGFTIASIGFVYAIVVGARRIFVSDVATEGWTTVMVAVLILGGLQLVMLGVLGEYLWRTTAEARRRPLFVVREVVGSGPVPAMRSGTDEESPVSLVEPLAGADHEVSSTTTW